MENHERVRPGWYVRIMWKGATRSKFFPDKVYKTKAEALKKGIAWRNKTEKELGKPRTERKIYGTPAYNTSCVIGVREYLKKDGNNYYKYVQVNWSPEPGVSKKKEFSINKFGKKKAWDMAVTFREKKYKESLKTG